MDYKKLNAIIYALLAALFYAINIPCSKLLLNNVSPTFMAAFLYLGAGLGVGIMYIFHTKQESREERLGREDIPYTLACFIFLQAMGKALESTVLSMIRKIVFGVGFALILPLKFGLDGVLYSMPMSDILTFLIAAFLICQTYKELSGTRAKSKEASV